MAGRRTWKDRILHRRVMTFGRHRYTVEGLSPHVWNDLYHYALTVSWPAFFAGAATLFLLLNGGFGLLYWLDPHAISDLATQQFLDAFFFSVETLATVGYGQMHPQSLYGHIVSTTEMFTGMSSIALLTGLTFARFSRPRARLIFARYPVVHPINGVPTLVIRIANERQNVIAKASAKLFLTRLEVAPEGVRVYHSAELKLLSATHPELSLGWSLMHAITPDSPLYGATTASLLDSDASLVLIIEGIDEASAQPMLSRHHWAPGVIRWNHRYHSMLRPGRGNVSVVDFRLFHQSVPMTAPVQDGPLSATGCAQPSNAAKRDRSRVVLQLRRPLDPPRP